MTAVIALPSEEQSTTEIAQRCADEGFDFGSQSNVQRILAWYQTLNVLTEGKVTPVGVTPPSERTLRPITKVITQARKANVPHEQIVDEVSAAWSGLTDGHDVPPAPAEVTEAVCEIPFYKKLLKKWYQTINVLTEGKVVTEVTTPPSEKLLRPITQAITQGRKAGVPEETIVAEARALDRLSERQADIADREADRRDGANCSKHSAQQ